MSVCVSLCLVAMFASDIHWSWQHWFLFTVSIKGSVGLLSGDVYLLRDLTSEDTKHVVRKTSCHRLRLLMTVLPFSKNLLVVLL